MPEEPIRIQDTLSGDLRQLEPRRPGRVGIYVCGPTVYGRIHVGNARPYVMFALFKRFLEHEGYDVTLVENITDINDKIYAAAGEQGVGSEALAREMTALYRADTDRLALGRPDSEPLATETLAEIIALIEALIEGGHAYASQGDVYFSVRSFQEYGKLSNRRLEDLDPQDQGEPEGEQALKRDPLDFALWKAHKPGEDTAWESPWGRGRPGWHIECSAMAEKVLGPGLRGARRRVRPRVPAPRERDRPDRGGARRAARAHLDAQRHDPLRRGEDGEVGGKRRDARRRARPPRARRADRVLPRGPLPAAAGLLGRAHGGRGPGAAAADRVRPAAGALGSACHR